MATGDSLQSDEKVVRALMHPYWDENLNRGTASAFERDEVSVSRLAVCSLQEIVEIFKANHNGKIYPPDGQVVGVKATGTISVADVLIQCEIALPDGKLPPVVISATEDPVLDQQGQLNNPAHALLQGWARADRSQKKRITKAVAKRILDACELQLIQ